MNNNKHAPTNYHCPICLGNQGIENDHTLLKQTDLIYKDDLVYVWLNSFWIEGNEGHVIVVPKDHFENIYEIPEEIGNRIFKISKKMALIIKQVYQADGITIKQNNEPAGDQHALHYHQHVFPRYNNDQFNLNCTKEKKIAKPKIRIDYVTKLKKYL